MKSFVVIFFFGMAALATAVYTDKYDAVNVDEILDNPRLLSTYVKCILDQGKCTAEGKEVKLHLQEALRNDCADCTDIQKTNSKRVVKHFINHEPEVWIKVVDKYDPTRTYAPKYELELRETPA